MDNLDCLEGPPTLGDHILNHQAPFSRLDLEPAPQDQRAVFLFGENETAAQLARHLLTDNEATHGWSDDRFNSEGTHLFSQGGPKKFHERHLL